MLDQLIESKRDSNPIFRPVTLAIAISLHVLLVSGIYARYHGHAATVRPPSPVASALPSGAQPGPGASVEK
jgi:hypothetical protein